LPVAPGSVQSGVPPLSAASVGQPLAALATDDETAGTLDDDVSVVVELHAASITAKVAAQAVRATEEGRREKFTIVTLQPYCAVLAGGWAVWPRGLVAGFRPAAIDFQQVW